MLLSCDNFTVASAKDAARLALCLVQLPSMALIYQCILAPNGLCIIRMSSPNLFIFFCWPEHDKTRSLKGRAFRSCLCVLRKQFSMVLLRSSAPGLPCTIHLDSGDRITSFEADRHHVACQRLIGHLEVGQGDQSQGPDNSQVILLAVEIGACARYIVEFFPERK